MDEHIQRMMVAGAVVAALLAIVDVFGLEHLVGQAYCSVRHPVEAVTSERATCERQHVIQEQHGGGHESNVVWINTTAHDYSDRSQDRPWQKAWGGMWGDWGDDNLKRAYKMGVYANGYHFMLNDYGRGGEGHMTLYEWDGASHVTYMIASVFNFITKEMSYIGHQMDRSETQWTDAVLGVAVDFAEVFVGIGYGIIGVAVGTVWNPLDTAFNLLGMVVLSVESIAVGLWNTVADVASLVTLGWLQWQTARW